MLVQPALAEEPGRGRHNRVFIVPAPDKVKIDGDLSDWDRSGELRVYPTATTSAMRNARFSMMYDAEAIYIGAVVTDDSPMMNRHDPGVRPDWAWDADVCQVRLVMDPTRGYPYTLSWFNSQPDDQMVHMTLWHFTDTGKPQVHVKYGMTFVNHPAGYPKSVLPQDTFEAKYREHDDGSGYTLEYRIPWATLGAKNPPKVGDLTAATMQLNWGRADGLKIATGAGEAYDIMRRPGWAFQESGCWGKAIFSETGNLPPELTQEGVRVEAPRPLAFEYELPEPAEVSIALFDEDGAYVGHVSVETVISQQKRLERELGGMIGG